MTTVHLRAILAVALLSPLAASGMEIRLQPQDNIYANQIDGSLQPYDLVLHGLRLQNDDAEVIHLESVEIRAQGADGDEIARTLRPPAAPEIAPSAHLDFGPVFLAADFAPNRLDVSVRYRRGSKQEEATATLPVLVHQPERGYGYPLRGNWYMRGIPSAMSHHRWTLTTEFAVDFFKVDAEGRISTGDRGDAANYYGFAEPVLAAADGVVEMVVRGMKQDRAARLRRDGESSEDYSVRMSQLNQQAMQEHGLAGATGNLIVLAHPNGERTAYAHLKADSLRVTEGDEVRRGQILAEVGDTGDSEAVHLHFQVMEGSQPMRSIPFQFDDIRLLSSELGSWVEPAGDTDDH